MRRFPIYACSIVAVAILSLAPRASLAKGSASLVERVIEDTKWLSSYPTRVVGTGPHDQAVKDLTKKIKAVPGATVWQQQFPVIVPHTENASLTITAGRWQGEKRPVYPLWPASVRLNTTPKQGIAGRLVYVGQARPDDLPTRRLQGQIAVMEITAGSRWKGAYNAGAKAIILLGSADQTQLHAASHLVTLPINVPRFYVPPGPLAQALRAGEIREGKIFARARWIRATGTNVFALIMPAKMPEPQQALVIGVPIDSMSVVPQLAPGADNAVDTALALNVLRLYARRPPARPVLFAFVDAYAFNQLGVRQMLGALAVPPAQRQRFVDKDNERIEEYRQHKNLVDELTSDRRAIDMIHEAKYKPLRRYVKDEVAAEVIAIEEVLLPLRLKLSKVQGQAKSEIQGRIDTLARRRGKFRAAQLQMLTKIPVRDTLLPLALTLLQQVRDRVYGQLDEAEKIISVSDERNAFRKEMLKLLGLTGENATDRPLGFLIGLDLSDAGDAVGPSFYCRLTGNNEAGTSAKDFRAWLTKQGEDIWPDRLHRAVSLGPLSSREAMNSYVVGELANFTASATGFGTAATTWATLDAFRERLDTPIDSEDRLDWDRLIPQIEATVTLLERLAYHRDFRPTTLISHRWTRVEGMIVDQSPGEPVARLPMKGYLTTLVNGKSSGGRHVARGFGRHQGRTVAAVRRQEFVTTGVDGRFIFDLIPTAHTKWVHQELTVQSYLLDDQGAIIRAIDLTKEGKGARLNIDNLRAKKIKPLRAIAFTCRELTGLEFFDPRFLVNLPLGWMLDAQRGAKPSSMNFSLQHGTMSCMLKPDTRWQILLRAGARGNRMMMLNVAPPDDTVGVSTRKSMSGFALDERPELSPVHMAARDSYRLDEKRIRAYRKAGITSKAIDELRRETNILLDQAQQAIDDEKGGALFRASTGALANEVRAYEAIRNLANDVVRAAIFLLLALIPFSYAMERLLLASVNVYRQILGMAIIFTVMTAILWSFHPAFRISNQPLMIIMAFGVIAMSLLVISMIYSKFSAELDAMRSGRAEASGAKTSRSAVLATAVRLGIANMRKRKLRTVLTGATICLITFALLCFTSATTYVGLREYRIHNRPTLTGVLIRQSRSRAMQDQALEYLECVVGENHIVAPRYWWCNQWNSAGDQWKIHVRDQSTGAQISVATAIGLSPHEAKLSGIDKVLPNWDRFAEKGGCYLAEGKAAALGVQPGDHVVIAGRVLELIGVFDPDRFDDEARDIDGKTLAPLDYSALDDQMRQQMDIDNRDTLKSMTAEMASGTGMEAQLPSIDGASVIILPARMLKGMRDSTLRSIGVTAQSPAQAKELARGLAKRFAFPIYYGTDEGLHIIASMPLLSKPPKSLFIPLIIAGFIIFNTMLNSVAERKREIYVYTSLGLAPVHVGVLFVAEAATYGLMGATFGYIVGQGVATLFGKLGWLGGITLNYSGTQAIATMAMVLVVVVLSSIVPAFVAGKIATPSEQMKWKVPKPIGDLIRDTLPFTVTKQTANGVMAFLYDFLDVHQVGGFGCFATDNLRAVPTQVGELSVMALHATIWLEPYDLGVRQDVRLTVRKTDESNDVYEFDVELHRRAGQVGSWYKLNRQFLGDLRKQLLGWRNLETERILQYIDQAAEMMENTREEVRGSQ